MALVLTATGAAHAQATPAPVHTASLLVVNQQDHNLSFLDGEAISLTKNVDVDGITGHEVAVSPDGTRAFIPIYGNSGVGKPGTDGRTITVVDTHLRRVVGSVKFDHGVRPHCAVFDKQRNVLYVTTELDKTVSIIDPATLKVVGSIPTGQDQSHMFVLAHDGRRGYTANVGPGTVSVLDMAAHKVLAVIPVSSQVQRISISTDDRHVFTADQSSPRLAVIDTATSKLASWIPLPSIGYGTAPTRDGKWLLVALPSAHQLAVIDLNSHQIAHVLDLPDSPTEVLIRPDEHFAYVSCGSKVAAIDLTSWKVAHLIRAGAGADGLAWAN